MIKGTTNKASWVAFVVLALGCGGKAENQGSASAGGSDASGALNIAGAGGSPGFADAGVGGGDPAGDAGAASSGCDKSACPGQIGECIGGYHWGTPPGACCPDCTPESTNDCAQGEINYGEFFQWQLDSNNFCTTDSDCAIGYEGNACNLGCGFAINAALAADVQSALKEYASNNCSRCPSEIAPPCIDLQVACMKGLCILTP
jgi:hypothetical protein